MLADNWLHTLHIILSMGDCRPTKKKNVLHALTSPFNIPRYFCYLVNIYEISTKPVLNSLFKWLRKFDCLFGTLIYCIINVTIMVSCITFFQEREERCLAGLKERHHQRHVDVVYRETPFDSVLAEVTDHETASGHEENTTGHAEGEDWVETGFKVLSFVAPFYLSV